MTVVDLLLLILVISVGVICVILFSKFSKIKEEVEKLKRGAKLNMDQQIQDAIVRVRREIGEKADSMFKELSAQYTAASVVTDKLGERMIAELQANQSLSQEFLRILVMKIVDRDTTLARIVGEVVAKMPNLREQVTVKVELLLDPNSGDDQVDEVLMDFLKKELPTFLAEWLADSAHRAEFVEKSMRPIVDNVDSFVEDEYKYQRDNDAGYIIDALKKFTEEIIAAELANPEGAVYKAIAAEIRRVVEEQF